MKREIERSMDDLFSEKLNELISKMLKDSDLKELQKDLDSIQSLVIKETHGFLGTVSIKDLGDMVIEEAKHLKKHSKEIVKINRDEQEAKSRPDYDKGYFERTRNAIIDEPMTKIRWLLEAIKAQKAYIDDFNEKMRKIKNGENIQKD